MKFIKFCVGDIVQMKKKHPCGSDNWEVLQLGSDMRVRCKGCEHITFVNRPKFMKNVKKVLNRDITIDIGIQTRKDI